MPSVNVGTAPISKAYIGTTTANKIYLGTTQIWASAAIPLTGLKAWYDADDASSFVFSSGNVVSQWKDKSGANNHLLQGTVPNQPTRSGTQNGHPTVVFTGAKSLKCTPGTPIGQSLALSIFWVFKKTGTVNSIEASPLDFSVGNGAAPFNAYQGQRWLQSSQLFGYTDFGTSTAWHVIVDLASATAPASPAGTATIAEYKNGTLVSTQNNNNYAWGWTNQKMVMAQRDDAATQFSGEIAEVIVYDRLVTTPERQQVEAYLKAKWGTP